MKGMTVMGVCIKPTAQCAGILVPLESMEELGLFDQREMGYHRVRVDPRDVSKVPFLGEEMYEKDHGDFFRRLSTASEESANQDKNSRNPETSSSVQDASEIDPSNALDIWVYVPFKPKPPTMDHPIVQSYVDTILRGCMDVGGERFCAEFLETTVGWHPEQWDVTHYEANDRATAVWVNDRADPVYSRGDPEHSRTNANHFDALMRKYRPDYFPLRVEAVASTSKR